MIASVNSIDSVEQVRSSNKLSNNAHDERESAQRSDSIPKVRNVRARVEQL
jgi:hypothetical protein